MAGARGVLGLEIVKATLRNDLHDRQWTVVQDGDREFPAVDVLLDERVAPKSFVDELRALERGIEGTALRGTVQNDVLKEYIARGTYIFPPAPSVRIATDVIAYCRDRLLRWNPISISGYHMREAGCTAVQEVAFTLANAVAYVEAARRAGLAVDDFAPQLSFFFNAHNDLIEEVAKFRAARRLWARLMRERFGARDPRSQMLRVHAQTAGSMLTAQQPENNVVRVTVQALAAVLGGGPSLHTNSMDEALSLPTERAVRIALRTQQIIAHESGVANTIDPLGGSYFLETLTTEMEEKANDYFRRIDKMGGVVRGIENGFFQREIADAAFAQQRAVEKGEKVIVGVNQYATEEARPIPILQIDEHLRREQTEKLATLRKRRDNDKAKWALDGLRQDALGDDPFGGSFVLRTPISDPDVELAVDGRLDLANVRRTFRMTDIAELAGVPPDAFTDEGQRWGNPIYDWSAMRATGFRWWIERFRRTFELPRWIDMPARGWHAADAHVHYFDPPSVRWEMEAEDLAVANVLVMNESGMVTAREHFTGALDPISGPAVRRSRWPGAWSTSDGTGRTRTTAGSTPFSWATPASCGATISARSTTPSASAPPRRRPAR